MTSNYHTPITAGAAANAQTFNDPLGQMDEALTEALLEERDGHIIQDEGVDLPQQARLDFVGSGVEVTNEVGKTLVTITSGGVTDHGALTGLADDDHPQYLLKSGLREWDEQGSDPSTPATGKWKLYFKATGLYLIDDTGYVIGPITTGDHWNYAINGAHDIAQRNVTPGTYFTVADKDYGADRWWVTRENADVQFRVEDATGETGLTCKNFGTYKKITNAGKIVWVQCLTGFESVALRGKKVTFQKSFKASSSKTIRMAVLELQTGGTIDAPPATLVTAFGADTVDPTFATNVAIITAAQSKSVTTTFQPFSVTVTVPNNSKNIMLAYWTDSDFAANDTLSVAEGGLRVIDTIVPWKPRHPLLELLLCQHYFYRWGYENSDTGTGFRMFGNGGTGVFEGQSVKHPVEMRAIPTAVVNGTWGTTNITGALSVVDLSTKSATLSVQVTTAGSFDIFTNSTDDWLGFESEIL